MKTKLMIFITLLGFTCSAQIKIDKQHFVDLLSQGKYGDVFREAQEIRKKEYGKCLLIDYFIAKALCGDGHNKEATLKYSTILKNYKLSDANRAFITNEKNSCTTGDVRIRNAALSLNIRDFSNIMAMNSPEAGVRGKMGMLSNCNMPPQELTFVSEVSNEELESRLFNVNQGEEAIRKYKSILNSNYHINVSGRFLLITFGNTVLNSEQITKTSERLERAYNFYVSHYNLRPPDKLLAVYLLPDKLTFRQTARLVHGIKVPDANIGYSNISDLSLVGVSDVTRIGTLTHEMFHLMVRTDIGDVPPWMDEGIACIYETSKWQGDVLVGDVINWRSEVLRSARYEMSNKIPHLREFIGYNWVQFDGIESNDLCKASINYAYGKHLMLYLQEEGKLTTLFAAVKNRNEITNDPNTVFQTDVNLFEQTFGSDVDTIERQFDQWLKKKYNIEPRPYNQVADVVHQPVATTASSPHTVPQVNPNVSNQPIVQQDLPDISNQQIVQQDLPNVNSQQMVQQEFPNAVNQQMVQQSPIEQADLNTPNMIQQPAVAYDANEVVNSLTIHVKNDANDKMGDAIAYFYSVDGDSKVLDNISEVNYQRNHTSFLEFKNKEFKKSATRDNKFSFKGYQWGYIETVYVYVVMKDKSKSDVILKTIVYDN